MKYIPSFTTIKCFYIALTLFKFFKCIESKCMDCEFFDGYQFTLVCSFVLEKAFDVFCKLLPNVSRPVEKVFRLKIKYAWTVVVILLFYLIYIQHLRLTTAITFCYLYHGIPILYRWAIAYIISIKCISSFFTAPTTDPIVANEPKGAEYLATTDKSAAKPVVEPAKPVNRPVTTTTKPDAKPDAKPSAEPAVEPGEPAAKPATTPTSKPAKLELDIGPKVYPDSHFSQAIRVLNAWISENKFNEISCSQATLLRNHFDSDFKSSARSILIELFSVDRCCRLKGLLEFINGGEKDSFELATALSRIIIQSFGFPDDTDTFMNSYFQFLIPTFVNVLQSCRDSFVCDYVLYNLVDFPTVDLILKNDVREDGVNLMTRQLEPEIYKDIDQFLNNDFMGPMEKPKTILQSIFTFSMFSAKQWIGTSPHQLSIQSILLDQYVSDMVKQMKHINTTLNNQMKKKYVSRPSSPDCADQNVKCPSSPMLRWDKQHPETKNHVKPKPSYMGPRDLEALLAALEWLAEEAKSRSSIPADTKPEETEKSSTNIDPLDSFHQQTNTMNHKLSTSHNVTLDYWEFLNYQPDAPEKIVYGTELGLFEDIVQEMRMIEVQMQAKLKTLLTSEKIKWLNKMHELSVLGLTSASTTETMKNLRVSFLTVIASTKRYQDYVLQYEKGYIVRQLIGFVKMYKYEIKRVCQMNKKNTLDGKLSLVCSLRNLTIASTCNVWNLRYVYERFTLFEPKLYKKELYQEKIETVYHDVFKLGKENMDMEDQELKKVLERIHNNKKVLEQIRKKA